MKKEFQAHFRKAMHASLGIGTMRLNNKYRPIFPPCLHIFRHRNPLVWFHFSIPLKTADASLIVSVWIILTFFSPLDSSNCVRHTVVELVFGLSMKCLHIFRYLIIPMVSFHLLMTQDNWRCLWFQWLSQCPASAWNAFSNVSRCCDDKFPRKSSSFHKALLPKTRKS